MNREQAINYLFYSGFSKEQINTIEQAFKQEPTTKNDLGVDKFDKAINQSDLEEWIMETFSDWCEGDVRLIMNHMDEMPSVTPQLSSGLEKNSKKLEKDFGELDCISRAQTQTEIEMNASRYTIAKERGGMGQVEWSDQLIKVSDAVDIIRHLPSVTPQEPRWIPVKFRPLTDEEQNEYPDYCYMADCLMPDDGEEILVCTVYGTVEKDECGFDDGFYLDSGYDWQTEIVAWMPLPKPYEAETEAEDGKCK